MQPKPPPHFLSGYSPALVEKVERLIENNQLSGILLEKYPYRHTVRSDKALYDYAIRLKSKYLRKTEPLNKVSFNKKLHLTHAALGLHTSRSKVQGAKLKPIREIHIATLFQDMPAEFLRMIVVHELAHIKEPEHNKAFYKLCCNMEPDYHQFEFDLRVYLTYLASNAQALWSAKSPVSGCS
ncbi:MAG: YgjP-like metallopeptidase domain-containing protein [Mariprofundaceae bacterium]